MNALRIANPGAFPQGPEPMLPGPDLKLTETAERLTGASFAKIIRGDPRLKEIALTFDDGPHPAFTPRLLALLRKLNIKATFFLVGKKVQEAPYLLTWMLQDGHDIGNHTFNHVNLTKIPAEAVEDEIRLGNEAIYDACGEAPTLFRPPGGQCNEHVLRDAEELKMTTVFWTDDPADYSSPGADIIESRLLNHVRPGAVILLHDGIEQTIRILPDFVARMRRAGYRFVTINEMTHRLEVNQLVRH